MTCGRYVIELGGESPLRTLVRRTAREGKGVRREAESEESRIQNAGLTNRKCIEAGALDEGASESEVQYLPRRVNVYATDQQESSMNYPARAARRPDKYPTKEENDSASGVSER